MTKGTIVDANGVWWTKKQWRFIEWLANPYDRIPPDQNGMAEELGVNAGTLSVWKKKPGFQDAVNSRAVELIAEDVPALLRAAVEHARAGNHKYWHDLMRMAGVLADEKTGSDVQIAVIFNGPDTTSQPWANTHTISVDGNGAAYPVQRLSLREALGQNGDGWDDNGADGDTDG